VKKVHPAKPELRVIKPSEDWTPVPLPDSIPGPMAVLICLDFLARGTKEHWERIASQLRDCRFIATPALSPKHTLGGWCRSTNSQGTASVASRATLRIVQPGPSEQA
jgi:hypothetical protein